MHAGASGAVSQAMVNRTIYMSAVRRIATVPKRIILIAMEVGSNPLCLVQSMVSSMLLSTPSYLLTLIFFSIYIFLIKKNIKKDTVAINLICNDVMKIRDYNLNFITIKSLDWSQV